jgi:hypothetical protein
LGWANARVVVDVDIVERVNAMKTTWTAVKSDAQQI